MNQRINFFLAVFALVISGAFNSKKQEFMEIILSIGTVLCALLALGIWRATRKLEAIFEELKADHTHPLTIIDNKVGGFSVRWLLGNLLPWGGTLLLLALALLSLCRVLLV